MELTSLTFEQLRLIVVVYTSSLVPLILIPYLTLKKVIPSWIPIVYIGSFLSCAIGWELWFTYGWIGGINVDLRREPILSILIPIHINWLLNSLADAGTICLGGLFITWKLMKKNSRIFFEWHWATFFCLLFIFVFQNILVEMFLYHDQLSIGKPLSWAPLTPLGPWFNPVLFTFNNRSISFQSQIPWLLMTPIFYKTLIYYLNNYYLNK